MATLRKQFLTALFKSLLRGKSLLQAILAYWTGSLAVTADGKNRVAVPSHRSTQEFLKEAEALFLGPVSQHDLQQLSRDLRKQFVERLQTDMECMLPSYSHQLPHGAERGHYLALDVGGSTLRVALVELRGRMSKVGEESRIVSMRNFAITPEIKDLEGMAFFDWMAARIKDTLAGDLEQHHSLDQPLLMAMAWSFPIEQTSLAGGKLQPMGKGFLAHNGLVGQDLGRIIKTACGNHDLNVELRAILNDSSACLLSESYTHSSTRFGLILGTGVNIAAYLPISAIGKAKVGEKPADWTHLIVNSEIGMFGHGILPLTRWDRELLKTHPMPTFQPYEHLVSGMYLGEICRQVLVEAIESTGVFGGTLPASLKERYSLATETLSMIQSDTSVELDDACKEFSLRHPSPHTPTTSDLYFLRQLASFISTRSSALVATCVYTFWKLRIDAQADWVKTLPDSSPLRTTAEEDRDMSETTVAFNGSVIENYPGYLSSCQKYLDDLVASENGAQGTVQLVSAKESSLLGAAVALASVEGSA
ncbi:hypothetical protein BGZ61DRAFT_446501 [Ilyonectria robusta]|uniref:uncharacterized protein n=1 Tax=Ilyonectria robusta TaxID=1079257 RepID=UPI001E8D2C98|nr:uncharacterized protein BGZ61DRAFT_446501 [Ilyonectria robusta]KAH8729511.1 hypothetical protein BGZ61DRAFT_446501 [Ilyonectria robusta]